MFVIPTTGKKKFNDEISRSTVMSLGATCQSKHLREQQVWRYKTVSLYVCTEYLQTIGGYRRELLNVTPAKFSVHIIKVY